MYTRIIFLNCTLALTVFFACHGQGQMPAGTPVEGLAGDTVSQVDGEIRGIWQDSRNNVWFASNGDGVYKYDGRTIVRYTEKHGLCNNHVWMVQETKDGHIWFKTYSLSKAEIALCRFDGRTFKLVEPDTTHKTRYFFPGDFLLCSYYFDGKTLSEIQIPRTSPNESLARDHFQYDLYATCFDGSGKAWFGTCTAGLCMFDGIEYKWFADRAICAPIRDIFEDRNGTVWVGNNGGGLFKYNGKEFVHFSKEKNLHNPDFETDLEGKPGMLARIWKITQDKKGNLWMATIDNGVWKYDGENVVNYTDKDGLGINEIWTVYVDQNDKLWVGTAGAGVYIFNGESFEKFQN